MSRYANQGGPIKANLGALTRSYVGRFPSCLIHFWPRIKSHSIFSFLQLSPTNPTWFILDYMYFWVPRNCRGNNQIITYIIFT